MAHRSKPSTPSPPPNPPRRPHDSSHAGMGRRGVTRPMAEMEHHDHEHPADRGHMNMAEDQRAHLLHQHHRQTLWVYWSLVLLGGWMILAPATFDYGQSIARPAGGRSLWLSDEARVAAMTWSDLVSGVLLVICGWRGLRPGRPVSLWLCCFVGVWMTFAPVVFWAPSAFAYANSTLVGMLVMALTVLIPGMPNMIAYMKMGGAQPAGWSYNPSSWPQRAILIALAFAGWGVSRYLASYQLGYIDSVWEPFFGGGSRRVLESDMSRMWPVSDAAFGALAYTFEFLMGFMGAPARWRTMPWMVTFFGILVIPLGLVHIALVVSQPVVVGEWCTLCLAAAALMLPMIPLAADEVVAMCQHIARARRDGHGFWTVFWKGGPAPDATTDERSPELIDFPRHPADLTRASLWGMSFPWTLAVAGGLGVALMALPGALGTAGSAATVFHLGGAVAVVVAVIAMGEPLRASRWLNVPAGLGIALAPWLLPGADIAARLLALVGGLAIAAVSLPRGLIRESFGSWNRFVR